MDKFENKQYNVYLDVQKEIYKMRIPIIEEIEGIIEKLGIQDLERLVKELGIDREKSNLTSDEIVKCILIDSPKFTDNVRQDYYEVKTICNWHSTESVSVTSLASIYYHRESVIIPVVFENMDFDMLVNIYGALIELPQINRSLSINNILNPQE